MERDELEEALANEFEDREVPEFDKLEDEGSVDDRIAAEKSAVSALADKILGGGGGEKKSTEKKGKLG